MGEFVAYGIFGIVGLILLYFFRKAKPIVNDDNLIFQLPVISKIGILVLFLFYVGLMVFAVIDGAELFAILFFTFFSFLMASIIPLLFAQFSISKEKISYRNSLLKKRTFNIAELVEINFSSNIGLLVFKFPEGKAKFYYGFRGSKYLYPLLLSRFEDKLTPKAKIHILECMDRHSIPLI